MKERVGFNSFKDPKMQSLPVEERLLAQADKKKENREKIKRSMEIESMKECSFTPNIMKRPPSSKRLRPAPLPREEAPIHERISDLQR